MEYIIANNNRNVFIKLNNAGRPETCLKTMAQRFPEQKAKNILRSLPRTMKKFNFTVVPAPDEEPTVLKNESYIVPNQVVDWVSRCNQLVTDAVERKVELQNKLSNADRELSNYLHEIELSSSKNACDGYKAYKKVKEVLEKRRIIKDELAIVQTISSSSSMFDRVDNFENKLTNRTFVFREVEDVD